MALLLVALGVVAVLAYQALDAARSHRRMAQDALQDYASFAAWEFARHSRTNVLATLISTFLGPVLRLNMLPIGATLPPEDFAADVRRRSAWCGCMDSARFFFRLDIADSSLHTTQGDVAPTVRVRDWMRDTIVAYARASVLPQLPVHTVYGSVDGRPYKLSVVITNDSYVTVYDSVAGVPRLIAYVLTRDYEGRPISAYGFESSPSAFVRPLLAKILVTEALLPPSLLRDVRGDSVLAVTVSDPAGNVVYRSVPGFPQTIVADDTLDARFGGLVVRVALHPALAGQLIVGGLPTSRLPILAALFALTAGLVAVALLLLRRQQELAQLRTEFVSGVSHELRTPLAQIRLFAELLHRGKLRTDEERKRSARIIDQEARRLTYLVENVLNFSRTERRLNRVVPEPANLAREINDALEVFAPLARARHATVFAIIPEQVGARVDRAAFRQMLLNLLDNAAKYGPAGQRITVGVQRTDTTARILVDDEGPGIPVGERERIWEPYHRLEREASSAGVSSGIGLAVVRELAELHQGRAWVEDAPGGGSRFVLELATLDPSDTPVHERPYDALYVTGEIQV